MRIKLWACYRLWFIIYIFFNFLTEIINWIIPPLLIGGFVLFVALNLFRLKPSSETLIEEILGNDQTCIDTGEGYALKVLAHRGGSLDAPENSIGAFKQVHAQGFNAVEFDVRLTADNVAVVFHDDTVDRVTMSTGVVKEMTWEQLQELDVSLKHHYRDRYHGEKIPSFHSVVEACLEMDLRMIINIKDADNKMIDIILDTFKKYCPLYRRAIISSFHPLLIYRIRRQDLNIMCALAYRPHFHGAVSYSGEVGPGRDRPSSGQMMSAYNWLRDVIDTWAFQNLYAPFCGVAAVLLHKDIVSSATIHYWREEGVRVLTWCVNLPLEKLQATRMLKICYLTDTLLGSPSPTENKKMKLAVPEAPGLH